MGYFRQLPNFEYVSRLDNSISSSDFIEVKNLFKRAKVRKDFFQNFTIFTRYTIIGDERPDNVAQDYYGDSELDWVVLYVNNIINVRNEWPLTQQDFKNYLLDKYGSIAGYNEVHHYETVEVKDLSGRILLEAGLEVDSNFSITYRDPSTEQEVIASGITGAVTNQEYELRLQNERRQIYLLRPAYLGITLDDIEEIMLYKPSSQYINQHLKQGSNIKIT